MKAYEIRQRQEAAARRRELTLSDLRSELSGLVWASEDPETLRRAIAVLRNH